MFKGANETCPLKNDKLVHLIINLGNLLQEVKTGINHPIARVYNLNDANNVDFKPGTISTIHHIYPEKYSALIQTI